MLRQILPAIVIILFFFVALFLFTKLAGPLPFSINSVTTTKSDTFTVSGEGKTSAIPDQASVAAGITANGTTVKQVQDQINATSTKITNALKALGVSEEDIQTTNYNVNPNYDFRDGSQRISGYNASTTLTIKIKDINKINEIIDSATQNGANQINQVNFEVSDRTAAENEARQKAVSDAKKKAENAAKIGGFQLGRLINYQESFNDNPRPLYYGAPAADLRQEGPTTQVQPGSNEIVLTVNLSYEVR